MLRVFILTLLLTGFTATQASAQANGDETSIRQVVEQYLESRRQRDEQSLRAILTEDVDQIPSSGILRDGIDAVANGTLATSDRTGGERSITIERIRFISPDVAIADGPYDIVNRNDGPDRHYLTSITLVRENERWKIAAIRNMQPR